MSINLILFDFGGVIASKGFQLGILKLLQLFCKSFEEMYAIAKHGPINEGGYTTGKINEEQYWQIIAKRLSVNKSLSSYRYVFMDNFQPPTEMLELIKKLRPKFKLGIFSDQTNWIFELDKKYNFFKYFDYKFISYNRSLTKHDPAFYQLPAKETGFKPNEILIIDDKERIVNMAEQFCMNAYLFTSIEDCKRYLGPIEQNKSSIINNTDPQKKYNLFEPNNIV